MAPHIFNHDARWRWVVSFTIRPLYRQGKTLNTHWMEVIVCSRAGSGRGGEKRIPVEN